jgi:hypothetical protein
MIIPTKHLNLDSSLLAVGGRVLQCLPSPKTVTGLWEEVREGGALLSFERFTLALAFLYAVGAIDLESHLIRRMSL